MPIRAVPAEEISNAMNRFDEQLRATSPWMDWENNQAHRYAVERDDKLYPVKQIISMAAGAPPSSFSGGAEANKYLQERGFEIVALRGADQSGVFLLQSEGSLSLCYPP